MTEVLKNYKRKKNKIMQNNYKNKLRVNGYKK